MALGSIINMEMARRYKLLFLGIAIVAAVVILFIHFQRNAGKPNAAVEITKPHSENISGQAGGRGSEEYNRKLLEHDDKSANEALKAGESFVPTPVGNKHPVVGKKEASSPPPAPQVIKVKTASPQVQKPDNSLYKRMLEDLATLDTKLASFSVGTGKIVYEKDFSKLTSVEQPASRDISVTNPKMPAEILELKPGDLLYAIIDTGVNSDVPSAVMATVAQGKYRNARMLGSFQRHDERIVLAFTRVILPNGKSAQIEAYAIDPNTSEASVASSVDTHFFSRWGGLVASAFLEGLGNAKRFSGATSTVYGYGNDTNDQMVWNNYSPADQAWIAAGKVGEKASKIFEKNFDRPPTVRLESGTSIGVLILNVKDN